MKIIRDYLESMFLNLPETPEILQMKADLLANMEDKYQELLESGASENEAIGQVISEFGNIQELFEDYPEIENFQDEDADDSMPVVDEVVAETYLMMVRRNAIKIALGVLLCIFSVCAFQLLDFFFSEELAIASLFLIIAFAIPLFITAGFQHAKYEFLDKPFVLPRNIRKQIESQKEDFRKIFISGISIGVTFILFALFLFFMSMEFLDFDEDLAVVLLLGTISIGVFIIVMVGCIEGGFTALLENAYDTSLDKKTIKKFSFLHRLQEVYWPVVVIVFLSSSFITESWGISWIIFPIAGIFMWFLEILMGTHSNK